ncbi:hypothetical protein EW093_13985 [Thiospirochaeta perfilievii]|uniref:Uncharacterized protein n=1 Tax=Thiospirochaeta perfilievii TaxID=252967 RepID=A0A5C1QGL8_9SPIO|nr:hypothetical protein [Thiospirochaeta perfilievii]QEN05764.1 hypothetical protein EW093_13985 [Thiospirochaeta perfilievii]
MKNSIYIFFFLITLVSCDSFKDNIIVLDDYFVNFNNINNSSFDHIINVGEPLDLNIFTNFSRVVLSPLVYKFYNNEFNSLDAEIIVLDTNFNNLKKVPNVKGVVLDNTVAYNDIFKIFNNNISVIMNLNDELESNISKNLKNLGAENNLLIIDSSITKNKINNFIKTNIQNTDLWIIDSYRYNNYAYELLKHKKIVIRNGDKLRLSNNNIVYSIETDYNYFLKHINNTPNRKIISKLKKY